MTQVTNLDQILSAASLLLAVAGALFAIWYPEIVAVFDAPIREHTEDRNPLRRRVLAAILSRALPLSLVSLVPAGVFLPDAVRVAWSSVQLYCFRQSAEVVYDSVKTAFVCVVAIAVGIALYSIALLVRLIALRIKLG